MKKFYLFGLLLISLVLVSGQQCETPIEIGNKFNEQELRSELQDRNRDWLISTGYSGNINGIDDPEPASTNGKTLFLLSAPENIKIESFNCNVPITKGKIKPIDEFRSRESLEFKYENVRWSNEDLGRGYVVLDCKANGEQLRPLIVHSEFYVKYLDLNLKN